MKAPKVSVTRQDDSVLILSLSGRQVKVTQQEADLLLASLQFEQLRPMLISHLLEAFEALKVPTHPQEPESPPQPILEANTAIPEPPQTLSEAPEVKEDIF